MVKLQCQKPSDKRGINKVSTLQCYTWSCSLYIKKNDIRTSEEKCLPFHFCFSLSIIFNRSLSNINQNVLQSLYQGFHLNEKFSLNKEAVHTTLYKKEFLTSKSEVACVEGNSNIYNIVMSLLLI
jgi:hypothetical protein